MPPRCARLLTVLSLLQLFARAEVTPLGDRRELFVDRAVIEQLDRT